jgi:hypothetical protein
VQSATIIMYVAPNMTLWFTGLLSTYLAWNLRGAQVRQLLMKGKAFTNVTPKPKKKQKQIKRAVYQLSPAALDIQDLHQNFPLLLASLLTTYLPQNRVGPGCRNTSVVRTSTYEHYQVPRSTHEDLTARTCLTTRLGH